MGYRVLYRAKARKELEKIDPSARRKLKEWIHNNLEGCENPRSQGRPMKGNHEGEWRYRVGAYRILVEIRDKEVIIMVISIGHRQGIYNQ